MAKSACKSRRGDAIQELRIELATRQQLIAHKVKAVGAPGFMSANEIGRRYVRDQCAMAADELVRACSSTGCHAKASDLEEAWQQLMTINRDEAVQELTSFLLPHRGGVETTDAFIENLVQAAEVEGRAAAAVGFLHFVAQQKRDARQETQKWWRDRVIAAIVGAIIAKSPDLLSWAISVVERVHG
jgi:hypothetical protein